MDYVRIWILKYAASFYIAQDIVALFVTFVLGRGPTLEKQNRFTLFYILFTFWNIFCGKCLLLHK